MAGLGRYLLNGCAKLCCSRSTWSSNGYTGADFYALCADALLKAMGRKAEELEATIAKLNASPAARLAPPVPSHAAILPGGAGHVGGDGGVGVRRGLHAALRELVPSVSQKEMEHYARVQQRLSNWSWDGGRDK